MPSVPARDFSNLLPVSAKLRICFRMIALLPNVATPLPDMADLLPETAILGGTAVQTCCVTQALCMGAIGGPCSLTGVICPPSPFPLLPLYQSWHHHTACSAHIWFAEQGSLPCPMVCGAAAHGSLSTGATTSAWLLAGAFCTLY